MSYIAILFNRFVHKPKLAHNCRACQKILYNKVTPKSGIIELNEMWNEQF